MHLRAHDAPLFKVVRSKLESFKCSVEYQGAVSWNALDPSTRNLARLGLFKNVQKKWLKDYYLAGFSQFPRSTQPYLFIYFFGLVFSTVHYPSITIPSFNFLEHL